MGGGNLDRAPYTLRFWAFKAITDAIWVALRGQFCMRLIVLIKKFRLFWVTHCQRSSNTTEIKITHLRTLRLFREQTISHCINVKDWKGSFVRVFFQLQVLFTGNLKGTPSSFQNQATQIRQPRDFIIMRLQMKWNGFQMKWNSSRLFTFYKCSQPHWQTTSSINRLCLPQ